jgi:DNA-binding HxlR family transcriptional regulator
MICSGKRKQKEYKLDYLRKSIFRFFEIKTNKMKTHQVFEVLSQNIRFEVVKHLNFSRKTFSELLACFQGLRSSQFSFHLKKLVESELIEKRGNVYELTEFGLSTLKFIEAYESDYTDYFDQDQVSEISLPNISLPQLDLATIPKRPEGLPSAVRTFEWFMGKNSSLMEDNFFFLFQNQLILKSIHNNG